MKRNKPIQKLETWPSITGKITIQTRKQITEVPHLQ